MTTVANPPSDSAGRLPAVELKDVCLRFGNNKPVLDNLDLSIESGQFVVLVGLSGCGKTTILNMIAGLAQPDSGTVTVLDQAPQAARAKMGYMPARDALLPWRSAVRNVEYPLELRGVPKARRREIALDQLERLHMRDAAERWPWQLSHGMRQRVALARTWAPNPELLLMDEPFAALDAQTRVAAQTELLGSWESNRKTVVFVTHDLSEALLLGDRVILVGEGGILKDMPVPFERPRTLEVSMSPQFQDLRHELWGLIH